MLKTLISSEIRRKVLRQLLTNPDEKYYIRQLAALLLVSAGSLYKELVRLEKEGVLKSEYLGTLRFFFANTKHPLYGQIKKIILGTKDKVS